MKYLFLGLTILSIILSAGCSRREVTGPEMNQLNDKGQYEYRNKDLGFSLILPKEFIYYQTQRKNFSDYTDLEIFVPSADTTVFEDISGYGKPVTIRVMEEDFWEKNRMIDSGFKKIGESKGNVYAIKFWEKIPSDWISKWSETMRQEIEKSIKI